MKLARKISRGGFRRSQTKSQAFKGWRHGLNTSVPAEQIADTELADGTVNYKINRGGQLETRPPIVKHTTTATKSNATIVHIAKVPIGSSEQEIVIDGDNHLYYITSSAPVMVATLEGEATVVPYKGVAIVLDGSYIKYMSSTTSVKIAYDDGTGTNGYQFKNHTADQDTNVQLGNGTNTRVAYAFTSQAWDTGYTIPITHVDVYLERVLNGYTGTDDEDIKCVLRKVSDDSVMASNTVVAAPIATNLATTVELKTVNFKSSNIVTEMSPSTAYRLCFEYDNGSATNHVLVHCESLTTGAIGDIYTTTWADATTKDPLVSLRPGRPPKGKFGVVHDQRIHVAGDPDNPSYDWFGNLTYLDWSTANGGGYVSLVDDDANNFPIGAMGVLFDDLFVYGKQSQPVIAKLTGSSPSEYSLPILTQPVWATHKTLISTPNNLWAGSEDGVSPLSGVELYGDVRTNNVATPIEDRLLDYWNTDKALAGYYPKDGQYWLVLNYHRVIVFHVNAPVRFGNEVRYPCMEYILYRDNFTSSSYRWVSTGSGTNEYELQTSAGADPSISSKPDGVTIDGELMTEGTAGSLDDHQWDYALDQTSTFYTVHVRDDSGDPDSTSVEILSILIPSALTTYDGNIYIGGTNGFIWVPDSTDYKDNSEVQFRPVFKSVYKDFAYGDIELEKYQLLAQSKGGAGLNFNIYKNGLKRSAAVTYAHNIPVSDALSVADMDMDLVDADMAVSSGQNPQWQLTNINFRSVQFVIEDIVLAGYPFYLNSILTRYRALEE